MNRFRWLLPFLVLAFTSSAFAANVRIPDFFESQMNGFLFGTLDPHAEHEEIEDAKQELKNFNVVFVTGFWGRIANITSFTPGYFKADEAALMHDFGAGSSETYDHGSLFSFEPVRPNSLLPTETNAEKLRHILIKTHEADPRPIILIAHSKGAAEALYAALAYPELNDVVAKYIFVDAAIGGSLLAEIGKDIDENTRFAPFAGLVTMRRTVARKVMGDVLDFASAETIERVNERVLYIRGYAEPKEITAVLRHTVEHAEERLGPNDGAILLEDQCLEGIGRDIGVLPHTTHTKLVTGNSERAIDHAFIKALFTSPLLFPNLAHPLAHYQWADFPRVSIMPIPELSPEAAEALKRPACLSLRR